MTAAPVLRPVSPSEDGRPNDARDVRFRIVVNLGEMLSTGQRYSLAFGYAGTSARNSWVVSRSGSY
jgi:hypothetical protein